ncbi:Taf13p [Ascoidea rubescens DSM 1968]|uniref:Transcription initiation factor TFIID subunit 13 n=1 Tax=Ascoidea rubescens DSM 1968 TaxID=1344418 RepID=A0A1D2VMH2_9ASCO|nr:TFIID-18kDa-domain-containing protein [Ascoidea rubescens DSM 1968]ODV62811.1 TFIID-18kDa-domain-containing protein [Ascoidea rubescens DSM 1968]
MGKTTKKKGLSLQSDIERLMFACGDVSNPLPETAAALESILVEYIVDISHQAALIAHTSGRSKIKVDDIQFALRKDPIKLGRLNELIALQKDILKAKKAFDDKFGTANAANKKVSFK